MKVKSYTKVAIGYKTHAIIFSLAAVLSACGAEGLPDDNSDQAPEIGAATESTIPESNTADSDRETPVSVSFAAEVDASQAGQSIVQVTESPGIASIVVEASAAGSGDVAVATAEALAPETPATSTATPDALTSEKPVSEIPVIDPSVTNVATSAPDNFPPHIDDTSYNCDPITESVSFSVGDTDTFTLSVTDEFPLHLEYDVDTSSSETASVTVDEDGVFTISALAAGESFVWLAVSDSEGLVDEYELHVIVE